MRGLINKLFMAQSIASLRPLVQQIADQLIDRVEPSGRLDAIRDLGNKLPVMTIMSIMGMPPEDLDLIKRWCDEYADLSAFAFDRIAQALEAWRSLTEYFRSLVSNRRAAPQSDLLSSLIVEGEQRGVISSDELLANCVLLLTAGHETTTNLIGNGLLALLRNPDQLQKLRDDPNLINGAVEELLRFDSPVQLTTRLVSEDMEFAGRRLKKGQTVYLVLGAANRDPEQFADPDRLEITRQECRHLAFGHGIHFCLGASLGRLEGQIALNTLLRRLPRLRQEECEIEWHPNPVIRGVIALPLCF
jgi:cytochrome P450